MSFDLFNYPKLYCFLLFTAVLLTEITVLTKDRTQTSYVPITIWLFKVINSAALYTEGSIKIFFTFACVASHNLIVSVNGLWNVCVLSLYRWQQCQGRGSGTAGSSRQRCGCPLGGNAQREASRQWSEYTKRTTYTHYFTGRALNFAPRSRMWSSLLTASCSSCSKQ